jgi:hypothetical protein
MNEDYIKARRADILDGKRFWGIDLCEGDKDIFFTEYVKPLRRLRGSEQLFDRLSETEAATDGEVYVVKLEIIGAINYGE